MGHDPHEGTATMVLPVVMLAGLAILAGLLELPFRGFEFLTKWLEPTFKTHEAARPSSFLSGFGLSMLAVVVGITGIVFAWKLYRRGLDDPEVDPIDAKLGGLGRLFGHAWYYDEGIAAMVGGPLRRSAQWLADVFDQKVLDGGVNGVARIIGAAGTGIRKLQTGLVRQYALGDRGGHGGPLDLGLLASGGGLTWAGTRSSPRSSSRRSSARCLVLLTPTRRPELAAPSG